MANKILVYWIGNIGISGPNLSLNFNPDMTINDIIVNMRKNNLGENKRIEFLKHKYGNLDNFDRINPYWSHNTKMIEIVNWFGNLKEDLKLVYCMPN